MDYEKKLAQLGSRYEAKKREADTKKGALLNTVESLKTEHGISTADEAKKMIQDLEKKVNAWEKERDELIKKIDDALDGRETSGLEGMEKLPKDRLDDPDDFEDFEDPDSDDDFDEFEDDEPAF